MTAGSELTSKAKIKLGTARWFKYHCAIGKTERSRVDQAKSPQSSQKNSADTPPAV